MIYDIKKIHITNFGSILDGSFDFENVTYLLTAENQQDKGQESNGGGKTTFIDAIAIAVFGFSLSGRSLKEYINFEEKQFETSVTLVSGNSTLQIDRSVSRTKASEISVRLDGEIPAGIPTKNNTEDALDSREADKWILDFFGIDKSDLLSYFLTAPDKYQSFYSYSSNKAIEFISRFANYEVIDKAIKDFSDKNKELVKKNEEAQLEINSLMTQIEDQKSFLEDLKSVDPRSGLDELRVQYNKQLDVLLQERKTIDCDTLRISQERIQGVIKGKEDKQSEILANATKYKDEYNTQIESIKESIDSNKKEILKIQEKRKNIQSQILHLEIMLENLITCPSCSHQFDVNSSKSQLDVEKELKPLREEVEGMSGLSDDKEAAIESFTQQLVDLQDDFNKKKDEANTLYLSLKTEVNELKRQIEDADYDINKFIRLDKEIKQIEQKKESLYSEVETKEEAKEQKVSKIALRIEDLSSRLSKVKDVLLANEDECKLVGENVSILEKFKFDLINDQIGFISNNINRNLELQDSDIRIKIDGFKKDSRGKIREQINPQFYRNTNPEKIRGYHSFSGGEKGKLDLASDILFQDMINRTANNGLNILVSDEIFSTIDGLGIENICKSSVNFDKTMIFVSHSANHLSVQNEIRLVKNYNGITNIL